MAKKWYVVHTYSGFENRAKLALEERVKREVLAEKFGEILIPTESVMENRRGEKCRVPCRRGERDRASWRFPPGLGRPSVRPFPISGIVQRQEPRTPSAARRLRFSAGRLACAAAER